MLLGSKQPPCVTVTNAHFQVMKDELARPLAASVLHASPDSDANFQPALAIALVSEFTCIYLALILHNDKVTALANTDTGSLIYNVRVGEAAPGNWCYIIAEEKKEEVRKNESENSYDDMCFGRID
ncbi:large ribosomal subunit protein P1-like [Notamacropus eugenii]|uniref:large ribosomal subunit protein P1-like n=1 Tax=Notamacropus eugenii TaxID=9315 RepID=UPI003B67FB06